MSNSSFYSQLFIGLSKPCHLRESHDWDNIFLYLRNLEALGNMRDSAVRELARVARLEHHSQCEFLFQKGEVCSSWYILVSGAVLVDGTMFLPRSTFGTRSFGLYRHQNCRVLTDSDFIVIDYQDEEYAAAFDRQPSFHVKQAFGGPSMNGYAAQISRMYELAGSESLPNYDLGRPTQAECLPSELGNLAAGDRAWYPPPYGYAHGEFPPDPGPVCGRPPLSNLPKGNRQSVASGASGSNNRRSRTSSFSNNDDGMSINSASDQALYAQPQRGAVLADSSRTVPYNTAVIAIGDEESASGSGAPQSVSDDDDDLPDDDDAAPRERSAVPTAIRLILEKETTERSVEEVEVLLSFVQPLAAFARHPYDARRALCQRMVIAVVDKANTIVIQDGEELDAWSVLVSGIVEMQTPEGRRSLAIGDAFGAAADMTPQAAANAPVQRFRGYMRTLTNDCQFLCVARPDYQRTMSELLQNTLTEADDNGRVVLVKERRGVDTTGEAASARGTCVIVRATVERLLCHLVEEHSPADASFVEDFLLTQRVFLDSPVRVFDKLFEWYRERILRDRVVRIVLLWLNAHFAEFERDATLMECLENFERLLASEALVGELALLRLACTSKARVRTVILRRSAPHEEFQFSVIGGRDWHSPVFVSKCERTSLAHQAGLRRGDQILEVNAVSFATFSHADAVRIFRSRSNDLRMRVRSNLLGFAQLVDNAARNNKPATTSGRQVSVDPTLQQQLVPAQRPSFDLTAFIQSTTPPARAPPTEIESTSTKPPSPSVMRRIAKLVRGGVSSATAESDSETQVTQQPSDAATTRRSSSFRNDDACSDAASVSGSLAQVAAGTSSSIVGATGALLEHVIRVYKSEQMFKYFLIHRDTTANHVVESAVVEFALVEPGVNITSAYSLCEVSVESGGVIRQKRLPDSTTNLADRLPLNARYFVKANDRTDPLVADSAALISEVLKDTPNNLMQITAFEIARCITIDDFDAFRAVQAHQYIVELFELDKQQRNNTQPPNQSASSPSQPANGPRGATEAGTGEELRRFAELIDAERFWTINEVLNAKALPQRMRVLKYFIKMARFFKLFRNYNSMFAVISGLSHHAVSRLKETWDKLPGKYKRTFEQLERLLDPTRSHANYRALLRSDGTSAPMIPIYPFSRKDLAFIHLGNSTFVDGLVNFDKMRLVGREVRHLVAMTNMPYDSSAFEQHAEGDASLLAISRAAVAPRGDSDELVPVAPTNGNSNSTTNGTAGPNAANTTGVNMLLDKDGSTMRRKRTAQRGAAKRMYDEALSLRRVRAYLSTLQIVRDETRLTELSYAIEAGAKSLSNHTATPSSKASSALEAANTPTATSLANLNANTSDITTTVSSNNPSLTGKLPRKRFGADTVEAENKLLSLVDKTKPTHTNKDKQASSSNNKSNNGFLAQFGMGRDRSGSSTSAGNTGNTTKSGVSTSATDSVDAPTQPRPSATNSTIGVLSGLIKASKANHPTLSAESSSVSVPTAKAQASAVPKEAPPPLHTVASQPSLTSHSKHAGMTHSVTSIGEQMDGTPRQMALDPNRPTMVHARKVSLSRVPHNSNQAQFANEQQSPVNGSRTLPFGMINHHFASTPSDTDSGRFSLSSASSTARLPSTEQQFANMQLNSHASPLSNSHGPSQLVPNNIRYASPINSSPVPVPAAPSWQRAYANNAASPYTNVSTPIQNVTPRYPMHQNSHAQSATGHNNSHFIYGPNSQQLQQACNHPTGTPGGQPFGPTDQIRVQQYVQPPNMPSILKNPRPNAPPDYNAAVNAKRNQLLADRVNMSAANVLVSRPPQPDYSPACLVTSAQQYAPMGVNLQYPVRKLSQSSSLPQCANSLSANDDDEQVSAV